MASRKRPVERQKKPRNPPPLNKPRNWAAMSRSEYLTTILHIAHSDLENAQASESHQAIASLHRLTVYIREELDKETKECAPSAVEQMSDDQMVEALAQTIANIAPAHFERLALAVDQRRNPGLRLVSGE